MPEIRVQRAAERSIGIAGAIARILSGRVLAILLFGLWCVPPTAATAQQKAIEKITSPDVLAHANLVRMELEYLQAYMGRPKVQAEELPVTEAEPREVFFQALTLFRKADRMCFEQTRTRGNEPVPPPGKIGPGHVYGAVDAALQRILLVKQKLNLDKQFTKSQPDPAKTPSDVFRAIVQANRQLNLMLDQQFAPSDVFQQVTLAVGYCERLLERFPGEETTVPAPPAYEPNKKPSDVYRRLLGTFETIGRIADTSDKQVLSLGSLDESEIGRAAPSDVYDIALLVVSELAYLHGALDDAPPPRNVYYPGRKFPSDVFQRAGILEKQLAQLEKLVQQNPDWLNQAGPDANQANP